MANLKIGSAILAYHNANRYYDIFSTRGLLGIKEHVKNVIALSQKVAEFQKSNVDMELLAICAEHHDDGRVDQYELLGKFWDNEVPHNELGLARLNDFWESHEFGASDLIMASVLILRAVILFHGRMHLIDMYSSAESKTYISRPYVEIVSTADDLENAYSCVSYLVREVETDAKGYIQANPQADQKKVSRFVWEHFEDGEKFDKMKYCSTYAEYVLSAATLATSCIKKYGEVAKIALSQPGYGYPSIIEGYRDVFSKTLTPATAMQAILVIESMIA